MVRALGVCAVVTMAALIGLGLPAIPVPPAASAPAPAQDSCVGCHTSRSALEPLVKPFPVIPAEGEG